MLEAIDLTREYDGRPVVDHVSMTVAPGRVTGFVGANGAGKTTTMRMLMGVLAPTAGGVRWEGSPITAEVRRSFGYMPEERGLYPRMKLREQLVFFGQLHGMTATVAGRRATDLLAHFGLEDRADDLLDTLSLGNQQRVQIAAALIHEPTALVLDEPFSGLDPVAVEQMVDLLREQAGHLPLLFSSHQLDLVERLCDDLVVLAEGRVVASGSVSALQRRDREQSGEQYRLVLDGQDTAWLRDQRGVRVDDVDGSTALLTLDGLTAPELAAAAIARGPLLELATVRRPLSEIYKEVTR